MATILAVDDDEAGRQYLSLVLSGAGHAVRHASDGLEAISSLEEGVPDLVVTDYRMPEMDGLELLSRIRQRWPELPVIMISIEDEVPTIVDAVRRGAVNYLLKPCSPERILDATRKALLSRPDCPSGAGSCIPDLIGRTKAIVEVRHQTALAARSDVNVLLVGETGTGKDVVARAIHACSTLAGGPFIAHNCAATPSDLFESQFFGYRRGAFTGADRDHPGLLEQANGGVLFLDELEAMSPFQQAKLLRVLDDGEVRPIGSTQTTHVSVRFFAATNRPPKAMVESGELRSDLYYRLRGFEIGLPPLRQRTGDIPLLAAHFLGEGSRGITAQAMAALMAHAWPGNVRELRNVVRRARAVAGDEPIDAHHLGLGVSVPTPIAVDRAPGPTLKEMEKQVIQAAVVHFGGNHSAAARALGIDRSTLRRKLGRME